mgnify:FL=1
MLKKRELDEEKEEDREGAGFVEEMGTRVDEIEMEEIAIFVCYSTRFFFSVWFFLQMDGLGGFGLVGLFLEICQSQLLNICIVVLYSVEGVIFEGFKLEKYMLLYCSF